jgi:hypothetical protein
MRGQIEALRPKRLPWVAAVAGGIAIGALVTLAVVANRPKAAPIVVRGTPVVQAPLDVPVTAASRKVVVPLPFLATHVTFDEQTRDLAPATDVTAFDVAGEAGPRHLVTVTALDGSRAEGYVREQDGIARPEPDGFTLALPDNPPATTPRPVGRPARPVGTVHDGFTKLR